MVVIYNQKNEDGLRYRSWERALTQKGKEVVLDCLEARLECYKNNGDEEGCKILEDLIELFNKKDN